MNNLFAGSERTKKMALRFLSGLLAVALIFAQRTSVLPAYANQADREQGEDAEITQNETLVGADEGEEVERDEDEDDSSIEELTLQIEGDDIDFSDVKIKLFDSSEADLGETALDADNTAVFEIPAEDNFFRVEIAGLFGKAEIDDTDWTLDDDIYERVYGRDDLEDLGGLVNVAVTAVETQDPAGEGEDEDPASTGEDEDPASTGEDEDPDAEQPEEPQQPEEPTPVPFTLTVRVNEPVQEQQGMGIMGALGNFFGGLFGGNTPLGAGIEVKLVKLIMNEEGAITGEEELATGTTNNDGEVTLEGEFTPEENAMYRLYLTNLPEDHTLGEEWAQGAGGYYVDLTAADLQGLGTVQAGLMAGIDAQGADLGTDAFFESGKYSLDINAGDIPGARLGAQLKLEAFDGDNNKVGAITATLGTILGVDSNQRWWLRDGYRYELSITPPSSHRYIQESTLNNMEKNYANGGVLYNSMQEIKDDKGNIVNYTYKWDINPEKLQSLGISFSTTFCAVEETLEIAKTYAEGVTNDKPIYFLLADSETNSRVIIAWAKVGDDGIARLIVDRYAVKDTLYKNRGGAYYPKITERTFVLYEYCPSVLEPEADSYATWRAENKNEFTGLPTEGVTDDYVIYQRSKTVLLTSKPSIPSTIQNKKAEFNWKMNGGSGDIATNRDASAIRGRFAEWNAVKTPDPTLIDLKTDPIDKGRGSPYSVGYTVAFTKTSKEGELVSKLTLKDVDLTFNYDTRTGFKNNKLMGEVIFSKKVGGQWVTIETRTIDSLLASGYKLGDNVSQLDFYYTFVDPNYNPNPYEEYKVEFKGAYYYEENGNPNPDNPDHVYGLYRYLEFTEDVTPTEDTSAPVMDQNLKDFYDGFTNIASGNYEILDIRNVQINNGTALTEWDYELVRLGTDEDSPITGFKIDGNLVPGADGGDQITVKFIVDFKDKTDINGSIDPCSDFYLIENIAGALRINTDGPVEAPKATVRVEVPTYADFTVEKFEADGKTREENAEFTLYALTVDGETKTRGAELGKVTSTSGKDTIQANNSDYRHWNPKRTDWFRLEVVVPSADFPPYTFAGGAKWTPVAGDNTGTKWYYDFSLEQINLQQSPATTNACGHKIIKVIDKPDTKIEIQKNGKAITTSKFYVSKGGVAFKLNGPTNGVFSLDHLDYGTYTLYEITTAGMKPQGNWALVDATDYSAAGIKPADVGSGIVYKSGTQIVLSDTSRTPPKVDVTNGTDQHLQIVKKATDGKLHTSPVTFTFQIFLKTGGDALKFTSIGTNRYKYDAASTNDKLTLTLTSTNAADGQTITVEGLTAGTEYTVVELVPKPGTEEIYTVAPAASQNVTIAVDTTTGSTTTFATVTFTNTLKTSGNLTVKKTVVGDSTRTDPFTFTVKKNGVAVPLVAANVTFDPAHANNKLSTQTGQFTLMHGSTATLRGLEIGAKYTIEETPVTGYKTSYTINGGSSVTGTATTPVDIVAAPATAAVEFTNERIDAGKLYVQKIAPALYKGNNPVFALKVSGNFKEGDETKSGYKIVYFTKTKTDPTTIAPNTNLLGNDPIEIIREAWGVSVEVPGVISGEQYKVEEIDYTPSAPTPSTLLSNYNITYYNVDGTVATGATSVTATVSSTEPAKTVKVENANKAIGKLTKTFVFPAGSPPEISGFTFRLQEQNGTFVEDYTVNWKYPNPGNGWTGGTVANGNETWTFEHTFTGLDPTKSYQIRELVGTTVIDPNGQLGDFITVTYTAPSAVSESTGALKSWTFGVKNNAERATVSIEKTLVRNGNPNAAKEFKFVLKKGGEIKGYATVNIATSATTGTATFMTTDGGLTPYELSLGDDISNYTVEELNPGTNLVEKISDPATNVGTTNAPNWQFTCKNTEYRSEAEFIKYVDLNGQGTPAAGKTQIFDFQLQKKNEAGQYVKVDNAAAEFSITYPDDGAVKNGLWQSTHEFPDNLLVQNGDYRVVEMNGTTPIAEGGTFTSTNFGSWTVSEYKGWGVGSTTNNKTTWAFSAKNTAEEPSYYAEIEKTVKGDDPPAAGTTFNFGLFVKGANAPAVATAKIVFDGVNKTLTGKFFNGETEYALTLPSTSYEVFELKENGDKISVNGYTDGDVYQVTSYGKKTPFDAYDRTDNKWVYTFTAENTPVTTTGTVNKIVEFDKAKLTDEKYMTDLLAMVFKLGIYVEGTDTTNPANRVGKQYTYQVVKEEIKVNGNTATWTKAIADPVTGLLPNTKYVVVEENYGIRENGLMISEYFNRTLAQSFTLEDTEKDWTFTATNIEKTTLAKAKIVKTVVGPGSTAYTKALTFGLYNSSNVKVATATINWPADKEAIFIDDAPAANGAEYVLLEEIGNYKVRELKADGIPVDDTDDRIDNDYTDDNTRVTYGTGTTLFSNNVRTFVFTAKNTLRDPEAAGTIQKTVTWDDESEFAFLKARNFEFQVFKAVFDSEEGWVPTGNALTKPGELVIPFDPEDLDVGDGTWSNVPPIAIPDGVLENGENYVVREIEDDNIKASFNVSYSQSSAPNGDNKMAWTFTATNDVKPHTEYIRIEKKFKDYQGNTVLPTGETFKFGLFDISGEEPELVKEVTLPIDGKYEYTFTDAFAEPLAAGEAANYKVFELDANGKRIQNNEFNRRWKVTYDGDTGKKDPATNTETFTHNITNTEQAAKVTITKNVTSTSGVEPSIKEFKFLLEQAAPGSNDWENATDKDGEDVSSVTITFNSYPSNPENGTWSNSKTIPNLDPTMHYRFTELQLDGTTRIAEGGTLNSGPNGFAEFKVTYKPNPIPRTIPTPDSITGVIAWAFECLNAKIPETETVRVRKVIELKGNREPFFDERTFTFELYDYTADPTGKTVHDTLILNFDNNSQVTKTTTTWTLEGTFKKLFESGHDMRVREVLPTGSRYTPGITEPTAVALTEDVTKDGFVHEITITNTMPSITGKITKTLNFADTDPKHNSFQISLYKLVPAAAGQSATKELINTYTVNVAKQGTSNVATGSFTIPAGVLQIDERYTVEEVNPDEKLYDDIVLVPTPTPDANGNWNWTFSVTNHEKYAKITLTKNLTVTGQTPRAGVDTFYFDIYETKDGNTRKIITNEPIEVKYVNGSLWSGKKEFLADFNATYSFEEVGASSSSDRGYIIPVAELRRAGYFISQDWITGTKDNVQSWHFIANNVEPEAETARAIITKDLFTNYTNPRTTFSFNLYKTKDGVRSLHGTYTITTVQVGTNYYTNSTLPIEGLDPTATYSVEEVDASSLNSQGYTINITTSRSTSGTPITTWRMFVTNTRNTSGGGGGGGGGGDGSTNRDDGSSSLVSIPDANVPLTNIPDNQVPLASLPTSGRSVAAIMGSVGLLLLGIVLKVGRKREDE